MIPDAGWSLLARLDGMLDRLGQAGRAIESVGQDTRLKKNAGKRLAGQISAQANDIRSRRNKVANGNFEQNVWSEVTETGISKLLDQCLLYLQAARSRGVDAPADLCEITDALYEELGANSEHLSWKSFSV